MGGRKVLTGYNDLETLRPDLMLDWDWSKNTKKPSELMEGSSYTSYWICHKCGHKWSCRLDSRTKNMHGCPMCARSGGSSVNDYTLYLLLSMSLDCEVLYRYNIFTGCEADVYIPSLKVAIEYDGYGFHKYLDKKNKDSDKDKIFKENVIRILRIIERQDRDGSIEFLGDIIKVPEATHSRYNNLKSHLVAACIYWGIINYEDIPKDYYELNVQYVKSRTSKPIYEKSIKYYLDSRDDIFWNYDNNGSILPEDIFATLGEKFNFRCKCNHEFSIKAESIKNGYGCPVCSNHRTKDVPMIDKSYNLSKLLGINPNTEYTKDIREATYNVRCIFCNKSIKKSFRWFTERAIASQYCYCSGCSNLSVIPLGIGLDNRLYYGVMFGDMCFLCIANSVDSDIILDRCNILPSEFPILDEEKFCSVFGDPYIKIIRLNSPMTLPINLFSNSIKILNKGVYRDKYYLLAKSQADELKEDKDSINANSGMKN